MTETEEAWTQTLITVTPEENGVLRVIASTTIVSSTPEIPLSLGTTDIVYRQSLVSKIFLTPKESMEEPNRNTETQTYLQGVQTVEISPEYKDEGMQTMYTSPPCPLLSYYRDIMTSMDESTMPKASRRNAVETIIVIFPTASLMSAVDRLLLHTTVEELEEMMMEEMEVEAEVSDVIDFLLARAFWISDPSARPTVETRDAETQTSIRFNCWTNMMVMDNETQTGLTCGPRQSNTELLSDYKETKNLILDCLEECLSRGIVPRITVDDIIDEIVDKCANRVRYPVRDQIAQTVASYKSYGEREADVLRKLRREMIVDPLESSIVVVSIVSDLLRLTCEDVTRNASLVVGDLLKTLLRRSAITIVRLEEIRKEAEPKPMDKIFDQRRRRILESMSKKETETVWTQTRIAGVPEVTKMTETKEVVCSVCTKGSMCWCMDEEGGDATPREIKMLRTQDILLAYKPCYIVARTSETNKRQNVQSVRPKEEVKVLSSYPTRICNCSCDAVNVVLKPRKKTKSKDSVSGWSRIIDDALMKPWSVKDSTNGSTTTVDSAKSTVRSYGGCTRSQNGLATQAAKALEILKSTFCTQETCTASLNNLKQECICDEDESLNVRSSRDMCLAGSNTTIDETLTRTVCCTRENCGTFVKPCPLGDQRHSYQDRCVKSNRGLPVTTCDDAFKVIPICLVDSTDS